MAKPRISRWLFRTHSQVRRENHPLRLQFAQIANARTMLREHLPQLVMLGLLAVGLTVAECLLPLLMKRLVRDRFYQLDLDGGFRALLLLVGLLLGFVSFRFIEIYLEKWLAIQWINRLRKAWYAHFITQNGGAATQELSGLMAKVTYHFGLLQMGIRNTAFPLPKFFVSSLLLAVVSAYLSAWLLQWVLMGLGASVLLMVGGHYLARYYVSKDQTLYSRILFDMHRTVSQRDTIARRGNDEQLIASFDELVDLDSYFRLRRELWVKFGPQLLFAGASVIVMLSYALEVWNFSFSHLLVTDAAAVGVVSGLMLRHMHTSLRIGLFAFPLYLGGILTLPSFSLDSKSRWLPPPKSLSLRSKSVRVGKGHRQAVRWDMVAGDRVRFDAAGDENEVIELLRAQSSNRFGKSWLVVHNGKRMSYNTWKRGTEAARYISPWFDDQIPISLLLMGKLPEQIESYDVEQVAEKLSGVPYLSELGIDASRMRSEISPSKLGWEKLMALQIVAAICAESPVVIVDSAVTRFPSKMLKDLLQTLEERCASTILVGFENFPQTPTKSFAIGAS